MRETPRHPDISIEDPEEQLSNIIEATNRYRRHDNRIVIDEELKETVAKRNPVMLCYSYMGTIYISTLDPSHWSDEEIIDDLGAGLSHEFMHELLYVMGDNGELTGKQGDGFDISRNYDEFLSSVIGERDLVEYAWKEDDDQE